MKMLLVRHPQFRDTESVLGFLVRLTEENGYGSPDDVRRAAGITSGSIGTLENLAKLAAATNHSLRDASAEEGIPEPDERVLGNPLDREWLPGQESTAAGRCCSQCIEDIGYIQAHWVLPLMIACPVHRTAAITACPSCRRPLWWYRPGLLHCACGRRVSSVSPAGLSEGELPLLDVLRRKMLNLPPSIENPQGLPVENLMGMDLKTLVMTIQTLARLQGAGPQTPKQRIVRLAAQILADWPNRFLVFLDSKNLASGYTEHRKHLNRVYAAICGWSDDQRRETAFIGSLVVEFALIRWGYRHSALTFYSKILPTGLIHRSLVSRETSLIGKSQTRGKGPGRMRSVHLNLRQAPSSLISGAFRAAEEVLSGAMAAVHLGIPETVLHELKNIGVLNAHQALHEGWGYHREDVDRFAEALLACSSQDTRCGMEPTDAISLRAVMAWEDLSIPARASLLRAVLAGELAVTGRSGSHVGDLLVSRETVRGIACSASDCEEIRTAKQVAKLVGCTDAAVPSLVRMGLLRATTGIDGWIYEEESIEAFRREYRFLIDLAKEERTTRDWLAKLCRMNRIGLFWTKSPKDRGKQPFIRVPDVEGLLSVVRKIRDARERRRANVQAALSASSCATSN